MKLVIEVEIEVLDPVARAAVLVRESGQEERVERVDQEVTDGTGRRHVAAVVRYRMVAVVQACGSEGWLDGRANGGCYATRRIQMRPFRTRDRNAATRAVCSVGGFALGERKIGSSP